jgi:hypothetical protein
VPQIAYVLLVAMATNPRKREQVLRVTARVRQSVLAASKRAGVGRDETGSFDVALLTVSVLEVGMEPTAEPPQPTRVGVYVDAFNVYYGGRAHCGRGVAGWRWLDLAALAMSMINTYVWTRPTLERLVYCTAPRDREGDPSSRQDQQTYINALREHTPELDVVAGKYAPRTKTGVLVDKGHAGKPRRVPSPGRDHLPAWLPAEEVVGPEGQPELLISVTTFEEKGSDVNVAANLLIDVLSRRVDAAMVFSNDSDLHCPLEHARALVPVATINPTTKPLAVDLRGTRDSGAGRHWWRRLRPDDFFDHQLPEMVGAYTKPPGW